MRSVPSVCSVMRTDVPSGSCCSMTRPYWSKRRLKRRPPAVAYISTRPCSSCVYTEIGVWAASESVVRRPAV